MEGSVVGERRVDRDTWNNIMRQSHEFVRGETSAVPQ